MSTQSFYDQLQHQLVTWAEGIPALRAIIVVGSQARQIKPADDYSDLDITLYVSGNHEQETESYLEWMRAFAPIWMMLEGHHENTKGWLILSHRHDGEL